MQNLPLDIPGNAARKLKTEAVRADVASRLRNVCRDWPEEEFATLVDKITRTAMKYAALRLQDEQRGR